MLVNKSPLRLDVNCLLPAQKKERNHRSRNYGWASLRISKSGGLWPTLPIGAATLGY